MTEPSRVPRLGLCAVVLTAFAAHARSLFAGFVYDDQSAILDNPVVQGAFHLARFFRTDFWGHLPGDSVGTWRPLAVLTLWLDRHLGGGAAWPFHLTSLLLHAAASVVLVLAVARVEKPRVAMFAGLIFASLAVNSEAVCGLVGRADVMAAGFGFLAWRCRSAVWASLGCALAFLCKESAVVWPIFLIGAELLFFDERNWRRSLALLATVAIVFVARAACFASPGAVSILVGNNPLAGQPLGVRALTAMHLGTLAVRTIVVPLELCADYSWAAIAPDAAWSVEVGVGGVIIIAATLGAWAFRKRNPAVAAGLLLFLVAFAAISNLAAVLPAIFAERLLYLPAAGLAITMAGGLTRLRPAAAITVLALVVGGNVVRAELRAGDWRDDLSLFSAAILDEPRSARSWVNYGSALLGVNRDEEASVAFEHGVEIFPTWAVPHSYAGLALARLGRLAEAEDQLRQGYGLDPDLQAGVFNLAAFLARHGDAAGAAEILRPYVAIHPAMEAPRRLLDQIEVQLRTKN